MKRLIVSLIALLPAAVTFAQANVKDSSIACPLVKMSYALQLPGADLADRFGINSNTGLAILYKTRGNLLFGIEGTFIFGNMIKEDGILDSISTADGQIISQNGTFATVRQFERGFTVMMQFGKLFPVLGPNPNSGIFFMGGAGFMQHKIRIDDIGNASPQLSKEYRKGYDRMTNGLVVSEFIGYQYLSNKRMINFYVGLECYQAFTKSRRSWDYDLMRADTQSRFDLLYGIRAGWVLPLYKKAPDEFYYY
ncbi:MAG: hypothetical protein AB1458_10690 [Bacteroidota bacterium]